eukprot:4376484-Pyramimonas_sp.AAC.1
MAAAAIAYDIVSGNRGVCRRGAKIASSGARGVGCGFGAQRAGTTTTADMLPGWSEWAGEWSRKRVSGTQQWNTKKR